MLIELKCMYCGNSVTKRDAEIRRRLKNGKNRFFCNLSCSRKFLNAQRNDLRTLVKKICPNCKCEFEALTGCKSPTYCSRSCASKGSMSDQRRQAQSEAGKKFRYNLIDVSESLKKREAWKYVKIKELLDFLKINYTFEHKIDGYVFDLVLPDLKCAVEFDGVYHSGPQLQIDEIKDKVAENNGYRIIRKKVIDHTVFDPTIIIDILKSLS